MDQSELKAALEGLKGTILSRIEGNEGKVSEHERMLKSIEQSLLKLQRPFAMGGAASGDEKGCTPEQIEHKAALARFLRSGDDAGLAELQRKAMNTGSSPDGGYLVDVETDKVIDRVAQTVSSMYQISNVVQTEKGVWIKQAKTSGMSMRRVAEGSTGGESTAPKYAEVRIEAPEAEVEPWVTNLMLEDSEVDLANDLALEAGIAFGEGAGSEFINGNGVGKARGILAYDIVANASWAWGKVGYTATGASGDFAATNPADKLIALQHSLKPQYRPGSVWLMSDATLAIVRQMKDGSGAYYLWQPDPLGQFEGRLLGHPVYVDDNMPAIAANSYSIAFGNFKRGYTIVNRTGTTVIRDPFTSKGTTKFNFRRRFGGGITNFEAVKLLKFGTT